jgi:tetratricopeptide (TPR) repeat protein
MARVVPMGTSRIIRTLGVATLCCCQALHAQLTGQTVRHHREAVEDNSQNAALTQAETAIDKKDYAAAEVLLRQIVEKDPGSYRAWFDLGFVCNALGKTDDSIAAYRKSVAAKPDVFESNLNLGLMLAKHGSSDAEQFLRAATKLTPTDHPDEGRERAWLSLAHMLEPSKPGEALEAYRQAALLEPNDPEPHLAAGLLLERQKDLAGAQREYEHVLTLDPQSVEANVALANVYMQSRKLSKAEGVLRKLSALRPGDAGVRLQLGRVLAAAGKNEDAIAEMQAGLKLTPGDRDAQRDLADLYAAAGQYDKTEPVYRELLAARPNDAELHLSLGQILMKQKKYAEAQQEFFTVMNLKPNWDASKWGGLFGDLAATANETKNYPMTIRALDARAKLVPDIAGTYFLRATAYDHLRDYKQAATNYHLFLEAANGQFPDQEWQARHRLIAIEPKK